MTNIDSTCLPDQVVTGPGKFEEWKIQCIRFLIRLARIQVHLEILIWQNLSPRLSLIFIQIQPALSGISWNLSLNDWRDSGWFHLDLFSSSIATNMSLNFDIFFKSSEEIECVIAVTFLPWLELLQIREWRMGRKRVKSKVEIDPAMPKDAGYYECQSDNKWSIDRRGFIAKYQLN